MPILDKPYIFTAIIILFLSSPLLAQPEAVQVARWVERLGAESFQQRNEAAEELQKLGPVGRQQLELAASAADPEIRLRAEQLLRQLRLADIWQPSRVQGKWQNGLMKNINRTVAAQSGTPLQWGDAAGDFREGRVSLELDGTFWQCIDRLTVQGGNIVRPHYDAQLPGLVVVSSTSQLPPTAYSGPLRGQVLSVRRTFNEELDLTSNQNDVTHNLQMQLQLMWEDRLHLASYRSQPKLVEAVTDSGERLSLSQPASQLWQPVDRGLRLVKTNLRFSPPRQPCTRLNRLQLAWDLIAVGEFQHLNLTDLTPDRTHRAAGLELTINQLHRQGTLWELTITVARDLATPEPHEVLFVENRISLTDSTQRPFHYRDQTAYLTDSGTRLSIRFSPPDAESTPAEVQFSYPTLRAQREQNFTFENIPLPNSRP